MIDIDNYRDRLAREEYEEDCGRNEHEEQLRLEEYQKEIMEIAEVMVKWADENNMCYTAKQCESLSQALHNAGYRKQEDTAQLKYQMILSNINTTGGIEYSVEFAEKELQFVCGSGKTIQEAVKSANDNLDIYIAEMQQLGKPIPNPVEISELIESAETIRGNIQAEIANAGTSCHWCMDKTKRDTAKEVLEKVNDLLRKYKTVIDERTEYDYCVECNELDSKLDEIAKEYGVEVD